MVLVGGAVDFSMFLTPLKSGYNQNQSLNKGHGCKTDEVAHNCPHKDGRSERFRHDAK
jgi:hypothetical protein